MNNLNNKSFIRHSYQLKRRELPQIVQQEKSQQVCLFIQTLAVYQEATSIALYQSIHGEIDLTPLWVQAIQDNKTCYMPVVHSDKTLTFIQTKPDVHPQANHLQILKPQLKNKQAISLSDLDLMIMPLLAFDDAGTRIGYGGGYYDRTLVHQRPRCLLGAAYSFQRHPHLTSAPWDIPMDGIVTEEGVYWV